MAEHRSQTKTSGDLLIISFARGLARELRRGQSMLQATQERHLLLTGQVLEVQRQILSSITTQPTAMQTPGISPWWAKLYQSAKHISEHYELAQRLYRAYLWSRLVFWPAYGYGALKWLGWL